MEATIFTFTLNPTLNEVFAGLTGFEPNPRVMAPLLWMFLFMLVAGSFACVQVLASAVRQKKVSDIVQMVIVESAVMFFEVIFLYRELIDAITPWIAQQSGGEVQSGPHGDAGARVVRLDGRPRHVVVPLRPLRHAGAAGSDRASDDHA